MASDAVGAEEAREKFRWSENSKVYSRKIHRANKNNNNNGNAVAATATNNQSTTTAAEAATSNQNTTPAADAAVAGIPSENDVSQTNKAARDNSGSAGTPAADGGDFVAPPDSQASPAKDANSQPQQPVSPNLQSSPAKDANSQPPQLVSPNNSPSSQAKDANYELPQPVSLVSQSSPARDADSEPSQLVSRSSPAKDGNSELPQPVSPVSHSSLARDAISELAQPASPVSQFSPARDANSELAQPVSPVSQSSPARDANSEPPQPVSQSSPAKDANSQPPQQVSPNSHSSPAKDATSQPESHSSPAKDTNSQLQQRDSPRTEAVEVVCDDSLSLNRQEGDLPNGNGVAPVRPVVTRVGDRVSISLSSAMPKHEARELKRKLLSDLDQVRSLAKRLDTKEAQVFNGGLTNSADAGAGGIITGVPEQSPSQYSTSEGLGKGARLRAHSEGISAGLNDSRPFRHLLVSVMDINRSGSGANETVEKEKRTPKANQFYQNSDFICGKDKLPPAESNKKHKSSGSKKHSVGGSEFDKHIFKKCGSLLQQLMKHKFSWVFNTPVDVIKLGLHDYYDIIKHPMDLGTVKNRLGKNWYKSPSEFAEDVRLTFNNAMTYNPEGQDVHVMAAELSNTFEQKWAEIEAEYNSKLRYEAAYDMGLPTPTSRLAPLPFYVSPQPTTPAPRPVYPEMRHLDRSESFALPVESRMKPVYSAPVGRAPAPKKPKAKDPNKRNMTFEEKQRLSTNLQALPSEKLDNIVQIITKRNPSLCQHDEEVEVDIDSVDAETLWELDRFVINYKKTLSKHKRKAELALQKSQTQQQTLQADNPGAQRPEVPKETTPDNANAAAGSNLGHDGKQADNASGSSSSSSSSSDSGSSSSDSDSDSSSGSGSDGGE